MDNRGGKFESPVYHPEEHCMADWKRHDVVGAALNDTITNHVPETSKHLRNERKVIKKNTLEMRKKTDDDVEA